MRDAGCSKTYTGQDGEDSLSAMRNLHSAIRNSHSAMDYRFGDIIGRSRAMQRIVEIIPDVASSDTNVVIYGESGTGKELIASTIHRISGRRKMAFVPVNCGAIPEPLFESEFFGHRKGAFTGAHTDKHGFLDLAHEGTLFLDEVGELNHNMQVKLLRAIEGGGYTPVGSNKAIKTDFRIIAATNRDLFEMVQGGQVRKDFFYRIHIIPINVSPLRERKEDIPLLVDHFLGIYGNGKGKQAISGKDLEMLCSHDWPGNVRELQNVLKRFVSIKRLDLIAPSPLGSGKTRPASEREFPENGLKLHEAMEAHERELISGALEKNSWHRANTARVLGIPSRTLHRKMSKHRLIKS